ncbi:hypothetical protein C8R44DRAFT_749895 [Mycena epipterygia]|nr:hypothetical protein C8R44DRAFT_749895 [Mycena epipterygia]
MVARENWPFQGLHVARNTLKLPRVLSQRSSDLDSSWNGGVAPVADVQLQGAGTQLLHAWPNTKLSTFCPCATADQDLAAIPEYWQRTQYKNRLEDVEEAPVEDWSRGGSDSRAATENVWPIEYKIGPTLISIATAPIFGRQFHW